MTVFSVYILIGQKESFCCSVFYYLISVLYIPTDQKQKVVVS
jgi:hypothetical protein